MASSYVLPSPQAFLDPLTEIENSYFYAIPKYWASSHANTRWFTAMIRSNRLDKISRKMELHPKMFHSTFFQLLDDPKLHSPDDPSAHAMFHKKAVLYLSALGLAMYLKNGYMVQLMLEYQDPTGDYLCNVNEPQYATHIQDAIDGDFHAYPCSIVMLRSGCYDYITSMLSAGWNPLETICMPVRRRYDRKALYYLDWLDYILYLMHERPMLPLARLVHSITSDPRLYRYQRLPIETILPPTEDERIRTGIVEVEQLSLEAKMIGVRSLLDIAVDYSIYLQTKKRYAMIRDCCKEMVASGVNPEIMMAHAQDYDAAPDYKAPEPVEHVITIGGNNASQQSNNAAASGSRKKAKRKDEETAYISEPTRILLHALNTNSKGSNKTPLLPLLDAVAVYVRRNFFLISPPPSGGKKGSAAGNQLLEQRFIFQRRDARNAIVILLNIIEQQYTKVEKIQKTMKEKTQGKFKHVDSSKHASNKLVTLMRNIKFLANLLFQVLLHTREIVSFIETEYPPYKFSNDGGNVDFALNPALQLRFKSIQMGVVADFNASQTAVSYMTMSDIERAANIKEMSFNMRLGKTPTDEELAVAQKSGKGAKGSKGAKGAKGKSGKTGNSSNVNENAVVNQPTPAQWSDSDGALRFLFNNAGDEIPRAKAHTGHVTFVKVKRKATATPANRQLQKGDRPDDSIQPVAHKPKENNAEKEIGLDVAARLTEQINQLRQSPDKANVALAGIYQRILDDLMARMEAAAKVVVINSDSGASDETSDEGKEEEDQPAISEESSGQDSEGTEHPTTEDDGDGGRGGNNGEVAAEEVSEGSSGARRCRVNKKMRCGPSGPGKRSWRSGRPKGVGVGGCGGGGGGGHRRGHHNRAAAGIVGYQKARVYEAPPEGTEFDLS